LLITKQKNTSEERLTQQECTVLANHLHPLLNNPPADVPLFYILLYHPHC